jgi:hypothetical protein
VRKKKKTSKKKVSPSRQKIRELGWREWVQLPELTKHRIKVKVDTGAQTSALHATDIRIVRIGTKKWVRFSIQPHQKSPKPQLRVKAELVEKRHVRSSTGDLTHRPVIRTLLRINGTEKPIEITLVNRDMMGFRMLLGRQAIRGDYVVNPSRSFVISSKKKITKSS